MKKFMISLLALVLAISVSVPALAAPKAKPAPAAKVVLATKSSLSAPAIYASVVSKEYKAPNGQIVMTTHAEVPLLSGGPSAAATQSINAYYSDMARTFVASLEQQQLPDALSEVDRLKEYGMTYSFYKGFQVFYNANNYLSVFMQDSYDMTGAHPSSLLSAATFDLQTGKKLALSDILPDVPAAMAKLFNKVNAYIKKAGLTEYVQTSGQTLDALYNKNDFVLTSTGIRFFFQEYSIGPYAAGRPSFDLTYKELGKLLIPVTAGKGNGAQSNTRENELRGQLPYLLGQGFSVARDMFLTGTLQTAPGTGNLLLVRDASFSKYQNLKDFLRMYYTNKAVESMLKNSPYVNRDGKLYVDKTKVAIKPTYDLSSYTYALTGMKESKATLTIILPAGKQITIPLTRERGAWRMDAMMFRAG